MKKNCRIFDKGLIHIYTGEGKGKTTAAVGLAMRAHAQGMHVCYISFHKDPKIYKNGEQKILKKLGIKVKCFARSHPFCQVLSSGRNRELVRECLQGINYVKKIFQQGKYKLLILDEIIISVRDGFIKEEEVLALMKAKPKNVALVMTGRGATKKMIKLADLVSYVKEIKHPYKKGALAKKGIEF